LAVLNFIASLQFCFIMLQHTEAFSQYPFIFFAEENKLTVKIMMNK